jgi:hypothetical protein
MAADSNDILVFSESEKVELLNYLSSKGQKKPDSWQLIHSEICGPDEANLSIHKVLQKISGHKFAIDIISNPDLNSFLDKGLIKVRYRYIVRPGKGSPIQSNTREFCEALVRADKIYRREDINLMSFKGSNPIAKQNYSIFRLQGHWNCRHAWQREIYFLEDASKSVENNELIDKQISMSNTENKNFLDKFLDLFKSSEVKLSKDDIVKVNKILLEDGVKFADVTDADGQVIRVDGDEVAVGSAVSFIDADGNEAEVPDGEYTIPDMAKIITVAGGSITDIKDVEDAAADAGDDAAASEGMDEIESRLSKFSEDLMSKIDQKIKEALGKAVAEMKLANQDDLAKAVEEGVKEKFTAVTDELKKMPAFAGDTVKHDFSDDKNADKSTNKTSISEALKSGYKTPEAK